MANNNLLNYKVFLLSHSAMSFALGLFMPFYIIFIHDFGGSIESFGFAIGLMILAQSLTSYYVGRHSDRFGRKGFLIASGFATTIVIIVYTFITSLTHLYLLQIIIGITQAMQMTMKTSLLGDVTQKVSRGKEIGKYYAITGVMAAIAMMGGGYLVSELGIKIIFYIVAGLFLSSTLILFYIKE